MYKQATQQNSAREPCRDDAAEAASQVAPRPFRLWMTSSLAMVMLTLAATRQRQQDESPTPSRWLRHSRFDVHETLARIERAVGEHGMTVLARLQGEQTLLVLASAEGGTPVVMHRADSQPEMPLLVLMAPCDDGGTDVLLGIPEGADSTGHRLPPAIARDLAALPGLVEAALA